MRGTFSENKLKIFTTTLAEIRETERLIFLKRVTTDNIQELSISRKEWNTKNKSKSSLSRLDLMIKSNDRSMIKER